MVIALMQLKKKVHFGKMATCHLNCKVLFFSTNPSHPDCTDTLKRYLGNLDKTLPIYFSNYDNMLQK